MRTRIWNKMIDIKFRAIYLNKCSRRADMWERIYSFIISIGTASSIATWAIWKQIPIVWALLVGLAQLLNLGKPLFPFLKNGKDFLLMSFEFESLYLEYERFWIAYDEDRIVKQEAEEKFYRLREKEAEIEKTHNQAPTFGSLIQKAYEETLHVVNLNFDYPEVENERQINYPPGNTSTDSNILTKTDNTSRTRIR